MKVPRPGVNRGRVGYDPGMPQDRSQPESVLQVVEALHRDVDRRVEPLERAHAERLQCRRGCADCCIDGLTVFEAEAEVIRRRHGALLADGRPGPEGACAFLDAAGACRVYESRPYVCRTQGLPLRWLDRPNGRTVEQRDICPLNEVADSPLERIPAAQCWTLGPVEGRLREIQERHGSAGARVPLRSLFRAGPSPGDSR